MTAKNRKRNIKSLEAFESSKRFLIKNKKDFQTSQTSYTAKIIRWYKGAYLTEFFFESKMRKRDLFLMISLKNQIKKNAQKVQKFEFQGIKYCVYNYPLLVPQTTLTDVIEIDLNSAYLHACFNMGLIDSKLFTKLSRIDKLSRLRCMGSIATQNVIQEYSNGKPVDIYVTVAGIARRINTH